jgi:hypothetical protein
MDIPLHFPSSYWDSSDLYGNLDNLKEGVGGGCMLQDSPVPNSLGIAGSTKEEDNSFGSVGSSNQGAICNSE